ncbi:MAG: alpha/beta hydrolase [Methylococcales bacterium]|nr:alpha/beta hydrolase [Methylococcales bacterium]
MKRPPPYYLYIGLLASSLLWQDVAKGLSQDFRCITPDWPLGSHSESMKPDADVSPQGMIQIILGFIDHLNLKEVIFVGNNSGGALAQMMVATHPERIEKLILTSCDAYEIWLPYPFKLIEILAFVPGVLFLISNLMKWPKFRGFGGLSKRMPKETSDSFALPLSTSAGLRRDYGKFLRAISPKLTLEAAKHFDNFNKPVLIAWSRDDRFFPKKYGEKLHQQFHDSKIVLIDDSYTFSAIDSPNQLTNEIRSFLKGV